MWNSVRYSNPLLFLRGELKITAIYIDVYIYIERERERKRERERQRDRESFILTQMLQQHIFLLQ